MATQKLKISTNFGENPLIKAIGESNLSEGQLKKLWDEWQSLMSHGAEMAETDPYTNELAFVVSDDFRRHCAAHGIVA